jgi:predicted DNA-binding protein with PD1-like motif
MKYTKGEIGKIFVLKFDNNDIFLDELKKFAKKEKLKSAVFVFVGALRQGNIVTGPKKPVIPPEPNWVKFKDGWEALGIGTIFTGKSGLHIHVHSSMGRKNKAITGCIRQKAKVFLVIEALVFELKGIKASKDLDPETGLNLLKVMI